MESQSTSTDIQEYARLIRASISQRAPTLTRWLWVHLAVSALMFLYSLWTVGSLMLLHMPSLSPFLFGWGIQGLVLIRLYRVEKRYLGAAVCSLTAALLGGIVWLVATICEFQSEPLFLLLMVPLSIVLFPLGMYMRCSAHAEVLSGADFELAECWQRLWKLRLVYFAVPVVCILLIVLTAGGASVLAAFAALALLGYLYFTELLYLYRTIRVFKRY